MIDFNLIIYYYCRVHAKELFYRAHAKELINYLNYLNLIQVDRKSESANL